MKKLMIALAAGSALLAPMFVQADATLYGSLRMEYRMVSPDADGADSFDEIDNRSSFIGAKFEQKWGKNTVFGVAEFKIRDDYSYGDSKYMYLGVSGDFGTVAAGKQPAPYYTYVNERVDVWNGEYEAVGYTAVDYLHGTSDIAPDAIGYITPSFGGFSAAVAMSTAPQNGVKDKDEDNIYHLAAGYKGEGFSVGFGYQHLDEAFDIFGLGADVSFGDLTLAASYEDGDDDTDGGSEFTSFHLYAGYALGQATLMAGYGYTEENDDDLSVFSLGVQYDFTKTLLAYVEYFADDDGAALDGGGNAVMLGAKLKF